MLAAASNGSDAASDIAGPVRHALAAARPGIAPAASHTEEDSPLVGIAPCRMLRAPVLVMLANSAISWISFLFRGRPGRGELRRKLSKGETTLTEGETTLTTEHAWLGAMCFAWLGDMCFASASYILWLPPLVYITTRTKCLISRLRLGETAASTDAQDRHPSPYRTLPSHPPCHQPLQYPSYTILYTAFRLPTQVVRPMCRSAQRTRGQCGCAGDPCARSVT